VLEAKFLEKAGDNPIALISGLVPTILLAVLNSI
tara:strand:+ start:325 stop:426 length:102 start_codon:yes stop_codon:yes gene_type:complete